MKRKELMAIVAVAAGLSSGVVLTSHAYAAPKHGVEQAQNNGKLGVGQLKNNGIIHPGHFIGRGHFHHGNGNGWGHHHHDHDIY